MIKTIYLVHHTHTDIGYTSTIDAVLRTHLTILDRVIRLCKQHQSLPAGEQFKWTIETALVVDEYRRRRPAKRYADLIALMRDGLIELMGLYAQIFTEQPSLQELAHLPEFAVQLGRQHGFPVRCAMLNDIPGATWTLPDVLSQSGIDYYVNGTNTIRTMTPWARDLPPLFRMQSPSGRDIHFWQFGLGNDEHPETVKSLHPQYAFGYFYILWPARGWYDPVRRKYLYDVVKSEYVARKPSAKACVAMARQGVASLVESAERRRYPYDAIMLQAGADNFGPDEQLCDIVRWWNAEICEPRVVISTPTEFFDHMVAKYSKKMPIRCGELSDSWSDHLGSKAKETADHRTASRDLRITGILEGITTLTSAGEATRNEKIRRDTLTQLMMSAEHTYGLNTFGFHELLLDGRIKPSDSQLKAAETSWRRKARYVRDAAALATKSRTTALRRLVGKLRLGTSPSIVVINTAPQSTTGLVEVSIPNRYSEYQLVDPATKKMVGSEVRSQLRGRVTLRFVAVQIPGCGFKAYSLKKGVPSSKPRRSRGSDLCVVENRHYRLELDPASGCPKSIVDKSLGRELVDARAAFQMNQYVHEEFADFPRTVTRAGLTTPTERIHHTASPDSIRIKTGEGVEGPFVTATSSVAGPAPARLKQKIVLYDYAKRIDFFNQVNKREAARKEAVYFAFPFVVPHFVARCELAGAAFETGREQLGGSLSDYQAIQNVLALAGQDVSVLWATADAPLVCIGGMNALHWAGRETKATHPHLFSYIMNNTWMTNCPLWQGGPMSFRYSFSSRANPHTAEEMVRFGREVTEPLQAAFSPGAESHGATSRERGKSLLSIPEDGLTLEAVETSNDGRRVRIMLAERRGEGRVCQLEFDSSATRIERARRVDLRGEDVGSCRVTGKSNVAVEVTPYQIVVLELETS